MPTRSGMKLNRRAVDRVIHTDPRGDALVHRKAHEIMLAAKAVFISRNIATNEWETSEFTPPKYIASFGLRRIRMAQWRVYNDDPGWHLVEWGARAGGKTPVLRYRPLGRGLDIVAARNV